MASTAALAARKENMSVDCLPESLKIVDCEKRRGVARYYCYIIEVTRKNGDTYHIYRRYRQFDKMVNRLEERFPVEAGSIRASDRIIPPLPGKKYAKRSAVRNIAEERLPLLDEFLQKLFVMSDKIRYDSIVMGFLKPNHEDTSNPYRRNLAYPERRAGGGVSTARPKSPRSSPRSSLSPTRPPPPSKPLPTIHVNNFGPNKAPVSSKPAKPPPPRPTPPVKASISNNIPRAKALYSYSAKYNDELSFSEGAILTLVRKVDGDWYQCRLEDRVGMVPGNYISIIHPLQVEEDESSEDEWDEEETGAIVCRYKGRNITIELDSELIRRPVYSKLKFAIRGQLKDSKIVLNYKDSTGDLIEMVDDSDVQRMTEEGVGPTKNNHLTVPSSGSNSSWMIYVTSLGDTSVYHTHPYKKPKPV